VNASPGVRTARRRLFAAMRAGALCLPLAPLPFAAPVGAAQQPVESVGPGLREQAAGAENQGRFSDAADAYLKLVAQDAGRAEWVLAAARCLGSAGRFNDAIDLLAQKRAEFPDLLEIPALLARTYLLRVERDPGVISPEQTYDDAARIATEVLVRNPDHEDARLILAQARYALGDSAAALVAAEEAVRRHPERSGAHILVARIAFDEFRALQQRFEQEQPAEPVRGELVTAIDAARKRAQAEFTRAAELDPDRTFARVMLGEIAARDHDTAAALQHWGTALAIDPLARVDHRWIGTQLEPQHRRAFYRDARAAYELRADHDPARAVTLSFYEALALYEQGEWQPARELFAQVLRLNPDYSNAAYYGAMCAWRLGDEDDAEAQAAAYAAVSATGFADVLRALSPEQRSEVAGVVRYLGDRAFQHGRCARSRDLNHVTACLQDSADAWNNYAFLCRETGQYDEAFAAYQHAIEKEPASPQLWNDAAVVLQYHQPTAENLQKARDMYEHALSLGRRTLGDSSASALERERAEKAIADAEANLKELPPK
jgi:tetratricopeptide (TPR) repeat protein